MVEVPQDMLVVLLVSKLVLSTREQMLKELAIGALLMMSTMIGRARVTLVHNLQTLYLQI